MSGLTMEWHDLCFLHWRVASDALRSQLPPGLELDLFEGEAWLGLVPFVMRGVRPGGLPWPDFPEFNVRTYVRDAQHAGVWFFSLDAADLLAVGGARLSFGLPYFFASMDCLRRDQEVCYATRRRSAPFYEFRGRYRPISEPFRAAAGSLEEWLTERYWLFSTWRGRLCRARVHHPPWDLQRAEASLDACDIEGQARVHLNRPAESLLFGRLQKVRGEWLEAACPFPR